MVWLWEGEQTCSEGLEGRAPGAELEGPPIQSLGWS